MAFALFCTPDANGTSHQAVKRDNHSFDSRQYLSNRRRLHRAAHVLTEHQPKLKRNIRVLSERDAIDTGQILMGGDVGEACCGHQLIARIALVVTMLQ